MEGLRIDKHGESLVAVISGRITMENTPGIRAELDRAVRGGRFEQLVLELSDVGFMDSAGIGFLVSLGARLAEAGKSLGLLRPSLQVTRTLELVQLIRHFRILPPDESPDEETASRPS